MSNQNGWATDEDLDIANASTEPPPPLAVGFYEFEIVKATPEASKDGKPGIKLELKAIRVCGGDDLPFPRKTFDNVPLSKEAAFRVKGLALAADVEAPARSNFGVVSEFCTNLLGKTVRAKTKLDTYQGKTNHKIDAYHTEESLAKAKAGGGGGAGGGPAQLSADAPPAEGGTRRQRRAA